MKVPLDVDPRSDRERGLEQSARTFRKPVRFSQDRKLNEATPSIIVGFGQKGKDLQGVLCEQGIAKRKTGVRVLIDGHVHVMSADFDRYPTRPDYFEQRESSKQRRWQQEAPLTLESYEQLMDEADVSRAVLTQPFTAYAGDNSYLIECVLSHPGRFVAVGAIGLDDDVDPVSAVADLFATGATAAIRLFVSGPGQGGSLQDPKAFEIAELAGRVGKPVRIHLERNALMDNLDRLKDLLGHLSGTRFVLDACGGPDLRSGAPWPNLQPVLELATFTNLSLMVTLGNLLGAQNKAFLTTLVDRFTARRIYWGSSFPHTKGDGYRSLVQLVVASCDDLSSVDKTQFLSGTVSELFPGLAE